MGNAPTRPGIDAFHRERSKCVDAFVVLEAAIREVMLANGLHPKAEPLGHKLGKLEKIDPSPKFPEKKIVQLRALVARCLQFGASRNDVVHSRLELAVIGEQHKACFVNLNQDCVTGENARLFSLRALRDLSVEVDAAAAELRGLLS